MHPHSTPNGSTPSLPGWSRSALALIAMAGGEPIDLYLRVSGSKQEKEQTIETQDDILTSGIELCGGRVGEKFKDDPFTGTVRDRPGLNKAMAAYRRSQPPVAGGTSSCTTRGAWPAASRGCVP